MQESYNIPTDGTQIVIDGLLVEEDMIVRNAFVELTPAVSVFYDQIYCTKKRRWKTCRAPAALSL